jgi:hypothetical protein
MAILPFRSSPLPIPTPEYSQKYQMQFIRTLEIYFGQISSVLNNTTTTTGTGGVWAPMVTGTLPGPELMATGDGQCIMVQIG